MWNNAASVPLPSDGAAFLGCMPGPQVDICYYDKQDGCYHDYFYKQVVEPWFWMPLPAPPTAQEWGAGANSSPPVQNDCSPSGSGS
jgi:hypothetical protein